MIYDLIYIIAAVLTMPYFFVKALFVPKYRAGLKEKLGFISSAAMPSKDTVWFHCVSVGEVLASVKLIREFRKSHPEFAVAVSTTTNTGRNVAEKNDIADVYFYYPFDFSWVVSRVLAAVKPKALILTELEVWPNMLRKAFKKGIPVAVVNGRLSERSFKRFRMVNALCRNMFSKLAFCSVQDETYRERFVALGTLEDRTAAAGNMKYDSLTENVDAEKLDQTKELLHIKDEDLILMGGSTHEGEERILLDAYNKLLSQFPGLRLVLVPRHPERLQTVCAEVEKSDNSYYLKSKLTGDEEDTASRVIIVDTMGELSMLYVLSTIAFVGGSFAGTGGQNMLEPVIFKKPVVVGPTTFNFDEDMRRLRQGNGICEADTGEELIETVGSLLADPEKRMNLGKNGYDVIQEYRGAVDKNLELLKQYIFKDN
ncbi:3-deoxy-D-manno-octulosonic acid transferase [Planctomycetota bacterium]